MAIFLKLVIIFGLSRTRCERIQPQRLLQSGFKATPYDIMAPRTLKMRVRGCKAAQEQPRSKKKRGDFLEIGDHFRSFETSL